VPKRSLRSRMLLQRRQLPEAEVLHRSFAAQQRLLKLESYRQARTIAFYSPIHNEVSTVQLLRDALANRRSVVMPQVAGNDLVFRLIHSLEDLAPGSFGILEPKADTEPIAAQRLDMILLPGVAFDRRGHRLGYGKGYYDRALSTAGNRAKRVGLAYDFQLVGQLPVFAHDMQLDLLVTETQVLRFDSDHFI
jgi:5-formyltetrahydrofolate cyclo-ligase